MTTWPETPFHNSGENITRCLDGMATLKSCHCWTVILSESSRRQVFDLSWVVSKKCWSDMDKAIVHDSGETICQMLLARKAKDHEFCQCCNVNDLTLAMTQDVLDQSDMPWWSCHKCGDWMWNWCKANQIDVTRAVTSCVVTQWLITIVWSHVQSHKPLKMKVTRHC